MKAEIESGFIEPPHRIDHSEGITGMSEIYVSRSGFFRISIARHLGRKVIIKSLKPDCATNPLAVQQLNKEFSLSFPIESRYVSRQLASISLPDGTPAIEMEFCQGDTLRSLFDCTCRFTPGEASEIVNSLLLGLEDIHRMGVVHRDIKPSNIIFDRDTLSLKIIDFGCAHSYDYLSLRGPAGTIPYTPPEKRHGDADPHPCDDLFAAGMVIMELAGNCTDKKMQRRLESFAKALSSHVFSSAREALDSFNRNKHGKHYIWLLIAVSAIVAVIGGWYLLSPRAENEGMPASATSADNDLEKTILLLDSMHSGISDNPGQISSPTSSIEPPDAQSEETLISEDVAKDIPPKESDQELRLLAIQAGPMVQVDKKKYPSDHIRAIAFAITSADSIYTHHLHKEFPKGSQTSESLSKAVDSIFRVEYPGLEPEYRRRAGKAFDRNRFKVLFTSRLEYMLEYYGAVRSEADCFKTD